MQKHISKSLNWLLRNALTVFSCVAIITLGMGAVAYSSTSTTIGTNISTGGNLTVSGTTALSGGGSLTGTWTDLGIVTTVDINGGTVDGITSLNVLDDTIASLGTGADSVLYHKTTSILANTAVAGVLVGVPVTPALAADSLVISNTTASGDVLLAGNRGGNSEAFLVYDSSLRTLLFLNRVRFYQGDPALFNLGIGFDAMTLHIPGSTGSYNVAVGHQALYSNVTGSDNTAVGSLALSSNTAFYNTAVGHYALGRNTTGTQNIAVGGFNLENNTTGNENTAVGFRTLGSNITGHWNVAVGHDALELNSAGDRSTAVGNSALENSLGTGNTGVGQAVLYEVTTGTNNTAIGLNSGRSLTTGSNNTFIGAGITVAAAMANNIILATGDGVTKAQYDGTNWLLPTGNVGIGTTSPATTLDVNGIIKTQPASSRTCNALAAGGIYFDSDDNHFYGCNGTAWVQLDN